ncbi:protein Hook homolog 3-like [Lethenteron reissneri]|uniref:protein Hook homolog 3-like n=1 Tax=Lethenteron reissneri TaxID=7753 RepID=UPI002AB6E558|nr:protein Hook homolog 3-like [Lethenteron reissneri]
MEAANPELCCSLLVWVTTFTDNQQCLTVEDLADGVVLSDVLQKIDPGWFDATWVTRVRKDVGDSWRLKVSNLKKVLQGIQDYYSEVLGVQVSPACVPDVAAVGEHADHAEMGRLLQLVLGCAINCENKQEHIENIMQLEESVQHVVMAAIQELLSREGMGPSVSMSAADLEALENELKRSMDALQETEAEKAEITQRCHVLDQQASALLEERNALLAENEALVERLHMLEAGEDCVDGGPGSSSRRGLLHVQAQLEELREENFRLEAAKDECRIQNEQLHRELLDAQEKNVEMSSLVEETQILKDEMDILKHSSSRVAQLEGTVESYRRRLEELGELRRQVRLLEERNEVSLTRAIGLEEELRRANATRAQLEISRTQAMELQSQLQIAVRRVDQAELELKSLSEKHDALLQEKGRLVLERDALREENDELHCSQLNSQAASSMGPGDSLAGEILPLDVQEQVAGLQSEKRALTRRLEELERKQADALSALATDSACRHAQLEADNRLQGEQVSALQARVEELQSSLAEQVERADNATALNKKLDHQLETLQESRRKEPQEEQPQQPPVPKTSEREEELESLLRKKTEDMRSMEERYKRYLEKAKLVIRTMDPKQSPEMAALRGQLLERERQLNQLQKENEQILAQKQEEEKLMTTAWYSMGMGLQRQSVQERLAAMGGTECSFLSRQRSVSRRTPQSFLANPATPLRNPAMSLRNTAPTEGNLSSRF